MTIASPGAAGRASTTWIWRRPGDAVVAVFPVGHNDQIMLVTDAGMVIRCPGRRHPHRAAAQPGRGVFKVGEGERVVSVARLPEDADDNGDAAAEDPPDDPQDKQDQQTDTGDT